MSNIAGSAARSGTRASSIRWCANSPSPAPGILCEAPYEIVAHKRIGKNVGVTDEQNAALEDWKSATCFNEVQRAALAFTDEIVGLRRPTDATFNAIAAKLTPAALVELQLSVGFYIMTSKFLETFDIDMQPAAEMV